MILGVCFGLWLTPGGTQRGTGRSMAGRSGLPHPASRSGGREARRRATGRRCPANAGWAPVADRPDPVALLEEQNATREPDLVPVRHGRMMVSPFTFYRGAAKIMAADLAATPTAGLNVQLCGDAHLSNFGAFASPERRLVFDLNDFDETLPGPFEYDVKRMAASFTIAARNNGFSQGRRARGDPGVGARLPGGDGRVRRRWARWTSGTPTCPRTTCCTAHATAPTAKAPARDAGQGSKAAKQAEKTVRKETPRKAHTRDSLQALSKLGELVDGRYRIVSQPPVVVPARDLGHLRHDPPTRSRTAPRAVPRLPGHPAGRPAAPAGAVRGHRHGPQGRRASAASAPGPSSCCCRAATSRTRCSCRSRRPPRRCWRTTCPRAATSNPGNGWCRASG